MRRHDRRSDTLTERFFRVSIAIVLAIFLYQILTLGTKQPQLFWIVVGTLLSEFAIGPFLDMVSRRGR